jgi:serine/threonine protein kinase
MHDGTEDRESRQSEVSEDHSDQFFQVAGAKLPPNYSLVRTLGQGSMAHVFLVRNTALKRLAALKVLRKEFASDSISCKRFIREGQASARISHPAVTSVYTVGTLGNNHPFIEMQYIDGFNLAEILRGQGRLDVSIVRKLMIQLSSGLAAAHECQVIHRDIKPANVLIDAEEDHAYLTDFGVAGILVSGSEAVTRLTRAGDRLGDPFYMSPEQLRGEVLTPQSDVYSLGLLGYEMLTSHGPFGDAEVTDIVGAHIRRPPIDLHQMYPYIPRDLADILRRCLSKKPENRPRAKAMSEILGRSKPLSKPTSESESPLSGPLVSFLQELRNRRVYRAAMTYAAVAFVVLQVADLILPPLSSPAWVYEIIVVASVSGFPMAMTLAWVFDLRKGRLTRTDDADVSINNPTSPRLRLLFQALGLTLSILVSVALAWWLLGSG